MQIQPRDFEIVLWILLMKFASLEDITRVFFKGCNPNRAPYRRILKLMEAGLIEKRRIYRDSRDFYVATWKAIRYLRSLGFQYVPALPKKESFFNHYEHDRRLIELRIFAKELGLGLWIPERVIRSIKPKGVCPDAILYNFDQQYAVEYEWNEKETQRYKNAFDRYQHKEKYDAVLYILPTEARIEKLWKKMPSIPQKIYFISEERFFVEKEKAAFKSHFDALPLKHLLSYSFTEGTLESLERDDLKELVQSEGPEDWKQRKPFIPFGGGGGKRNEQEEERVDETGDQSDLYPSMYPDERDRDEQEDPF